MAPQTEGSKEGAASCAPTNTVVLEGLLARMWKLTVQMAKQLGYHYMLRGEAAKEYHELEKVMRRIGERS